MFTGIIEEIGKVSRIQRQAKSFTVTIQAKKILDDVQLGDSIAVNGVCLTVTRFNESSFDADVMPETFMATSLSELSSGSDVNLERAMAANGRFGGHFVSGHVDGTGTIVNKRIMENALYMTIQIDEKFKPFLMEKGSIAIDGTSLTVFKTEGANITISLVPHTQSETILAGKSLGGQVNIECDMLAKYLQNIVNNGESPKGSLSLNMLADNGFI